jgi:hypothetical protein
MWWTQNEEFHVGPYSTINFWSTEYRHALLWKFKSLVGSRGSRNILRRKILRRIILRQNILRSKKKFPRGGRFFAGVFFAQIILHRIILRPEDSSLRVHFARKILRRMIFAGKFFARMILRRRILRPNNSSQENSSLGIKFPGGGTFSAGAFFARMILRRVFLC